MENDFSIKLAARRTQNMLILGSDHKRAELLYCFAAISILFYSYCGILPLSTNRFSGFSLSS